MSENIVDTVALAERLQPLWRHYPAVEAVYLFGSAASGRAGTDSDIDLGVVGPLRFLRPLKLDLLAGLVNEGVERADLVLLEESDPILRFEAVRPNRLIYARPDFDHGSYYSRTVREYFDLEPYLHVQREAMKRRLLGGET